jgi:hypothetical protein
MTIQEGTTMKTAALRTLSLTLVFTVVVGVGFRYRVV